MKNTMIVAGVMSGTSADGINVALVRIGEQSSAKSRGRGARGHQSRGHTVRLLGHAAFPYPARVRSAILAAMNAESARVANLARLNFLLGELYADSIITTQKKFGVHAELIGCHGQTLYHQGEAQLFLGKRIAATWQTGESAVMASWLGVPVVSDFRPADIVAGGKGAPLVPFLDYLLFRDEKIGRIVQNIGGIANLTAIPALAGPEHVIAFDTGPGNMLIDAVTDALYGRRFDRGGRIAASGAILESVLRKVLSHKFFRLSPPKTAGREEFGREFVHEFLQRCRASRKEDVVATATALTASSITESVRQFVLLRGKGSFHEMIVSGGGVKNATLLRMLRERLAPLKVQLRLSDEFELPSEAKEAVGFAVLAYETWNGRASNIPSATGAKRPAVLGKISYA